MTAHLRDRLHDARNRLPMRQSRYRVIFEDPADLDAGCYILIPDPNWLAAALEGGILPPIEVYLIDKESPKGFPQFHPYATPIGAMSEEQAIEYLIQKDIPRRVWNDPTANAPRFRIVPVEAVPTDRTYRDAWEMSNV
jgi:hypothetical protein